MVRTKGSKDLHPRKKYRKRKKKLKLGNMMPYHSKRHDKNAPLKIWWWERVPMTKAGYYQWNRHLRAKIHKKVTKFSVRVDVEPELISSKKAIEELALNTLGYTGEFLMMMFTHFKSLCY